MPVLLAQFLVPLLGLFGPLLVLVGLPGTWLALAVAGLCEWGTVATLFSHSTLVGVLALAIAGEAWEFFASAARAKRAGAGRRGAIGALVGGILGALVGTIVIPIPLVGTLVGGGLGAFGGAASSERRGGQELRDALRIGRAAALGHALGLAGKFAASVGVWLCLTIAVIA